MPRGFERFIPWSTAWPASDDSLVLSPIFTSYDVAFLAYCGIRA